MNSPQNSTRVPENPSVTGLLIQNNTEIIYNNTDTRVETGQNVTGNPTTQPNNTTFKANITAVKLGNSKIRAATPKSIKDQILAIVSEAYIISRYVPGFKGIAGTFFNPLTPNEKNKSLSIYQHKSGKGLFLHSKNTGHDAGDVFQFVADLKGLNNKTDFLAVGQAIVEEMRLNLLDSGAGIGKNLSVASVSKSKAPLPAEKLVLNIQTSPEYSESFLKYWWQWKVTAEILRTFNVQQVLSNKGKSGKTFSYSKNVASLFIVDGWEKIIVAITDKKKEVSQNAGKESYIFGLEQARKSAGSILILCEGEKDLLVLATNGFAAITLASANARLKPKDVNLIKEAAGERPVFIIYDNDKGGKAGSIGNAALSGFKTVSLPETYNDIADYFAGGHSAEEFGALLVPDTVMAGEKKNLEGCEKETPEADVAQLFEMQRDKHGNITGIKLKANKILEQIKKFGFGRHDSTEGPKLIHRRNNVIKPVTQVEVADTFFRWLKAAPETIGEYPKEKVLNKFYDGSDTYFSEKRLYRLEAEEIDFRTDTQNEIFFFFENGFVTCTPNNWLLLPYSELKGCIWESQIIGRKQENNKTVLGPSIEILEPSPQPYKQGIVAQFLFNICGQDGNRFLEFSTILGYLLHNYFESRRTAVLLTDSSLENGDNGRTGKSLLSKLLGFLKPTASIDGKLFKADNKFQFQEVKQGTQVVVINDLAKQFSFEQLYNAVTEGITVEKKNQMPFLQLCKILLTTNAPIKIDGASGRDRIVELEVSDHYSDTHSVMDDFPNKWFLSPDPQLFSQQDWNEYFNLFFCCCSNYLRIGIQKPAQINLDRRKLEQQTPEGFPDWLDEQLEQGKIKKDDWIDCDVMHNQFLEDFPDFKSNRRWNQLRYFRKALEDYVSLSRKFKKLIPGETSRRSGSIYKIIFAPK